jgi:hypothetical protein
VNACTRDATASLDYVIATVAGVPGNDLARELETFTGLRGIEVPPLAAYRGYSGAAALCNGGERLVTVQWGIGRDPLVIAPGQQSSKISTWLQGRYEHQCSRKDAAVDFTDPGAFDVVAKAAIEMAIARAVKTSSVGDWLTPGAPDGRTLYIYSRKSTIFIRIYEHSKLHGGDVTCRVEVEVKPDKKPGKQQLAVLDVHGVLGLSTFMVELLEKFGINCDYVPLAGYVRQLSDLDQRLIRCHMQYGRTFDELLQMVNGDLSEFTTALFAARDVLERRRAQTALAAARPQAVPLICL